MAGCAARSFQIPASTVISRRRTVAPSAGAVLSMRRRPSSNVPSFSNRQISFKCSAISKSTPDIERIDTDDAPAAVGPYSQGIIAQQLYLRVWLPRSTSRGEFISEETADQTEQALKNIGAILKAGGADYDKVVKTTIMLADVADFELVNQIYNKYFQHTLGPARSTFQAGALPKNAKIEIDAIAII